MQQPDAFQLCSIVASLQLAQATLASIARQDVDAVDMLVLANATALRSHVRHFFSERRMHIVDVIKQSHAMREWVAMPLMPWSKGIDGNKLKLASLWMVGYDRVMMTDWDNLLLPSAAHGGFHAADPGLLRMHSFPDTPFLGSWWIARPTNRVRARFGEAIHRGWTPCTGWGGPYSPEAVERFASATDVWETKGWKGPVIGPWWKLFGCDNSSLARSSGQCRHRRCFAGFKAANSDQGMAAHLAYDERYRGWAEMLQPDNRTGVQNHPWTMKLRFGAHLRLGMAHFAGNPKPWDAHWSTVKHGIPESGILEIRKRRTDAFWKFYWPHVIAPDLRRRQDATCIREYEAREVRLLESAANGTA